MSAIKCGGCGKTIAVDIGANKVISRHKGRVVEFQRVGSHIICENCGTMNPLDIDNEPNKQQKP